MFSFGCFAFQPFEKKSFSPRNRPNRPCANMCTRNKSRVLPSVCVSQIKEPSVGLGAGTICTGSTNLLIDPASTFASSFFIKHAQETRHTNVRKPTKCVSGREREERREEIGCSNLSSVFS